MLCKRFLFTRQANAEALLLEKEDMRYGKKGMVDKNSQACKARKNNKESYTDLYMSRMQEEDDEAWY